MSELEFIQRCVKLDKLAWDEFIDKYSRLIYKYIHGALNLKANLGTEPQVVNDLYQEIILSLVEDNFKKLRSFKGKNGASIASWLRQVTINHTIDYLRRYKPATSIDQENNEGQSLKDVLGDNSPAVTDKIIAEEKLASLADCIERLESQEKYFLRLHINKGVTLDRLKDHLGLSRPAVDMRKSRIVEKLRECFKSKGFEIT